MNESKEFLSKNRKKEKKKKERDVTKCNTM